MGRPELDDHPTGGNTLTAIATEKEKTRRISAMWSARDDLSIAEVTEIVETEMADEAATAAAAAVFAQSIAASIDSMTTCPACRSAVADRSGLCPDCSLVATIIRAERAAADQVRGHDRRQLVEAHLSRTERGT
jgi:hypothetical protein